ncbi:MAG: hypothetical protein K2H26_01360, partial [Ruminococcus sp.]|nr:hypothetical protein [Ruminococcus sp.]
TSTNTTLASGDTTTTSTDTTTPNNKGTNDTQKTASINKTVTTKSVSTSKATTKHHFLSSPKTGSESIALPIVLLIVSGIALTVTRRKDD